MSKKYSIIPNKPLDKNLTYVHPKGLPKVAHMEDPALSVMTDFKFTRAITIKPDALLTNAAIEMEACNVHMLLVIDSDKNITGMITTEDLLGEKPLTITMTRQIKRSEVLVRMVMLRQEQIATFDINELKHAKIGDLVETLHELKQHYALVLENNAEGKEEVRGIFSLYDLSRRVGSDLTYDVSEAHSLAELQHKLDG